MVSSSDSSSKDRVFDPDLLRSVYAWETCLVPFSSLQSGVFKIGTRLWTVNDIVEC